MPKAKKPGRSDLLLNLRMSINKTLVPLRDQSNQMMAYLDEVVPMAKETIKALKEKRDDAVYVVPKTPTAKKKRKALPGVSTRCTRRMAKMQGLDDESESETTSMDASVVKHTRPKVVDREVTFRSEAEESDKENNSKNKTNVKLFNQQTGEKRSRNKMDENTAKKKDSEEPETKRKAYASTEKKSDSNDSTEPSPPVDKTKTDSDVSTASKDRQDITSDESDGIEDEDNDMDNDNHDDVTNKKSKPAAEPEKPAPVKKVEERVIKPAENENMRQTRSKLKKIDDNISPRKRKQDGDTETTGKIQKFDSRESSNQQEIRITRSKTKHIMEASTIKPIIKPRLNHIDPRTGMPLTSFLPSALKGTPDRVNRMKLAEEQKRKQLELKERITRERQEEMKRNQQLRLEELRKRNEEKQAKAKERRNQLSPSVGRTNNVLSSLHAMRSGLPKPQTESRIEMTEEEMRRKKLEEQQHLEEIKRKREEHRRKQELQRQIDEEAKRKKIEAQRIAEEKARLAAAKKVEDEKLALLKKERQMAMQSSYLNSTVDRIAEPLSSVSSYNINDLETDGESDDEEHPRHRCPTWISDQKFKISLLKQAMSDDREIRKIWGRIKQPDLYALFTRQSTSFRKRTSSAHWDHPMVPRRVP
ncbi:DgyrCDS5039 [Dimorphilus gyrociliatus]|uniref:DgyrCDS5039 n=1 Tax=Dimorphilus gyrociliatus TaxID=2664684 RepID=A0A7I8VLB9_9ANNE|nr:DgyrCDS5039 [Dimorphilus gyrociliatus]